MQIRLPLLAALVLLGSTLGLVTSASAKTKKFDHPRFSFSFAYEDSWIPRVNKDGESVTFALEAGEILISVERARNPHRHKSTQEFADALIKGLKDRVVFDSLDAKPAHVGGEEATLVAGRGRLFDDPAQPYRVAIYVCLHEGRYYLVKYTGYYDSSTVEFSRFEQLVSSLRFKERTSEID